MIRSNFMLLTFGLLIFCFRDASSVGIYPAKCTYEPTIGICFSPTLRYFFYPPEAACMMFTYSGCAGNDNNFLTLEECIRECKRFADPQEICLQDPEAGRCSGTFPRFYYNTAIKNCEEFVYSGCGGNENNFLNWYQCRAACQNSIILPPKCLLDPVIGWCWSPSVRYVFNAVDGKCMVFLYSGCLGNENNFSTETECLRECKPTPG
ncbi:tissue factor pathway inhibitor-like [Crotalus tigris]|uniref:tissue factor pathway inhibitor-like n=1 Tax=Crotalus tigris TaxID=88082 RepID=UPI00192F7807|nr:tissue factor pathway inhibitor-like [Crotalus tigris]